MFWRLGFLSAWRNLARSMLAIFSMALAAGFLTNAVSLSRGYAAMEGAPLRALNGGEITVYDRQLMGSSLGEKSEWVFEKLTGVEHTDLAVMMPSLFQGYLAPQQESAPLTEDRIAAIAEVPSIKAVYPRYQLPAMSNGHTSQWATPLRGRDIALDHQLLIPPSRLIGEGRWFLEEDDGAMVAVVSAQQSYPLGQRATGLGDRLLLSVPRVRYEGERPVFDFENPLLCELKVIGVIDIETRRIDYYEVHETLSGEPEYILKSFPLYMQCDEIQIPLATWQEIWRQAGGREYLPQQLALMVDDMSYLEDAALRVQNLYPEYSVLSLPMLTRQALNSFSLENPEKYLLDEELTATLMQRQPANQQAVAADLRLPLTIMIFINAAMVIASNLLIMVSERRAEIGILKAVGAKRSQVVQMVLSEALLTSLLGAVCGFLFFRLPAVFNQLTNSVALHELLLSVAGDMALVFATTTIASLIFGMLPALAMARLSVREVLQSE